MNVSKIFSTVVNTVKRNPIVFAIGVGAYGVGVATSAIFGSCSVTKEEKQVPQQTQTETTPQTQTQSKPNESVFEYVSPNIGENGIVKADTNYFAGTKKPQYILYVADKNRPVQSEIFNRDGSLNEFTVYNVAVDRKNVDTDTYNNKGENTNWTRYNEDGTQEHGDKFNDGWHYYTFDKKENIIKSEYPDGTKQEYKYNPNGSYTVLHSQYGQPKVFFEHDKNDKEVRKKEFDKDGVVKYTVNTTYDKDGCVVKKDTVWNK